MSLSPSYHHLLVLSDDRLLLFRGDQMKPKCILMDAPGEKYCVTPDDKYLLHLTSTLDGILLTRIEDGCIIGRYTYLIPVSCLAVSTDGSFAMAATSDGRLYVYVIADPREESHTARIQALSSRNQPLKTDTLDIVSDPRFKFIMDISNSLRVESSDNLSELEFLETYESPRGEEETNVSTMAPIKHNDLLTVTKQPATINIQYKTPGLQSSVEKRLKGLKSNLVKINSSE